MMMLESEADSSSLCKIYNLQSVSISSEISSFASFHYRLECFQLPRVVDRVEETLKRDIPRTMYQVWKKEEFWNSRFESVLNILRDISFSSLLSIVSIKHDTAEN